MWDSAITWPVNSMTGQNGSKQRVLLSWSSGKDSAWTLYQLQRDPGVEVVGLLTTFNSEFDRSAIHGVRRKLVKMQAQAVGLPLQEVPLPWPCSNEAYEAIMSAALGDARKLFAMDAIAFGDLFLEDIRRYREDRMAGTGLELLFPVWGKPTDQLACDMIDSGLRARITCVDPRRVDSAFAGREFDRTLISELPKGVDPCGENGEFHSFAWAGPMFNCPLNVQSGDVVTRDGFVYADLYPGDMT